MRSHVLVLYLSLMCNDSIDEQNIDLQKLELPYLIIFIPFLIENSGSQPFGKGEINF